MDFPNNESTPQGPTVAYIDEHQNHIKSTLAHRAGTTQKPHRPSLIPLSYDYDQIVPQQRGLPRVATKWSADEKDAFFHALTIHSRLRPDLIAEALGPTKNISEVYAYIEYLETAAVKLTRCPEDSRAKLPIALEVTDAWVNHEEQQAVALANLLKEWEDEDTSRYRARQHADELALLEGPEPTGAEGEEHSDAARAYGEAKEQAEENWKHRCQMDMALGPLDAVQLKIFHGLLKADEKHDTDAFGDDAEMPPTQDSPDLPPLFSPPEESAGPTATPPVYTPMASMISDDMIDPALLELGPSTFRPRSRPETPNAIAGPSIFPGSSASPMPSSPWDNGPQGAMFPFSDREREGSASTHGASRPRSTEPPLTPKSRRRMQKAMYMRRKRAEANGGVVSEVLEKLKPGRRPKERPKKRKAGEEEEAQDDEAGATEETIAVVDGEEPKGEPPSAREPIPGGMTRLYKLKRKYSQIDLSASRLRRRGFGLISLPGLIKINKFLTAASRASEHDEEEPEETKEESKTCPPPFIWGSTISIMHAEVIRFVEEVMHRMVVINDMDTAYKSHTQAWKLKYGQAGRSQVHQALAQMGVTRKDPRTLLDDVKDRLAVEESPPPESPPKKKRKLNPKSVEGDDEEDQDKEDPPFDSDEEWNEITLPEHRTIFTPMIRIPLSFFTTESSSTWPLTSKSNWDQEVPGFYADDCSRDSLIPDDDDGNGDDQPTNEDAARLEVEEDEALDEADVEAEEKAERILWRDAGRQSDDGPTKRKRRERPDTLAFAPPGTLGTKSAVFIVDSDSD